MKSVKGTWFKSIMAALMLALALAAAGCQSASEVKVDESYDGRQVAVEKGQVLAVTLAANPSTGYSWERTASEDGVLQQQGEPEFTSRSDLLGAPGTQTIRFKAAQAGTTTLELVYHRSWEKDVAPEDTFTVEVVVR